MRFFGGLLGRPELTWSEASRQAIARPLRRRPQHHRRQPRLRSSLKSSLRDRVPALPRDAPPQASGQECADFAVASTPANSKPKRRTSRNSPKPSPSSSAFELQTEWKTGPPQKMRSHSDRSGGTCSCFSFLRHPIVIHFRIADDSLGIREKSSECPYTPFQG